MNKSFTTKTDEAAADISRLFKGVSVHADSLVWQRALRLLRHPKLAEAVLRYCRAMSTPSMKDWPSNKIFGQKFRYITAYCLIGHHVRWLEGGPAPTLKFLQDNVPASARQVADLIKDLKAGGYVQALPAPYDGRAVHLAPTPSLLLEVAQSPLACLQASELLDDAPPGTSESLCSSSKRLAKWLGASVQEYQANDILFAPFPTIVRFSERDAGYMVLTAIMGCCFAGRLADPTWQLRPTQDVFAANFKVSRQHIANLFLDARRDGLFVLDGGKIVEINPDLLLEFRSFLAGQMAHYAMMAERADHISGSASDPETKRSRASGSIMEK